jgi:two-component system, sensor histidine kinase and response regulator
MDKSGLPSDQKLNVMVVDDSKLSRRVILAELEKLDHLELSVHDNPIQALMEMEDFQPDVIISDYEMPKMSGLEFCAKIRSHEKFANIPFIIISGSVDLAFQAKALQAGVNESILKGFKSHVLSKIVERISRKKLGGIGNAILIVDDSRLNRNLMNRMLEGLSLSIYQAESVDEAQKILDAHPVELILLDHEMPGMKGAEWCGILKSDEKTSEIGIISVSATKDAAIDFLKAGADDFISKPYTKDEVVIKIQHQLKRSALEKDMKAMVSKEKTLNHQMNLLLGTAAHDLRNPIATIISYLSLVKDNKYDDEYTNIAIDCSFRQAEKTLTMLNDILDVSNINSGYLKLDIKNGDIARLLSERVHDMSSLAKKKSITLNFNNLVDSSISTLAKIDSNRLGQVIDNLLTNAIKYSHPDTITEVRLDKSPEGWLVQVIDGGQGIPADELQGLFNEFKRTSVQTTGGESSTGLGLAIVKKIVEAHSGVIWVESKVGTGSVFSFTLPYEVAPQETH